MPAGPSHIYFFLDDQNRSVYFDGLLGFSTLPRNLAYAPDGWKEISIVDQRNQTYWSLDIDFTIPLNFVKDGAQILKVWFSTKGTEEPLFLAIMEQKLFYDGTSYYYYYTRLYKSQVDFSSYKHMGTSVAVNMLDQSFPMQLKNKAGTTYQYTLGGGDKLYMDGIELQEKGNFQVIDGVTFSDVSIESFAVPFAFLNAEGISAGIQFKTQEFESFGSETAYLPSSGNWCAFAEDGNSGPVTLAANGVLSMICVKATATAAFFLRFRTSLLQSITLHHDGGALVAGQTYTYTVNQPIILAPGEKLFLLGDITNEITGAIEDSVKFLPNSKLSFNFTNRFKPSLVDFFDIADVFSKLIKSMTGGTFTTGYSNLLSRLGMKIAITSGDGIRGIANAPLKITWNNFWSLVNYEDDPALFVVGNEVHIETKKDTIDFSSIIDVGEVSGFQVSTANSLKFNRLKIGCPNQDYGATNGKDEFMTTLEMSSPVNSVSTEVDFISDVRLDGFGMEFIRTGLDGKTTTDNIGDGAPFGIHITDVKSTVTDPTGAPVSAYLLNRALNPYASGVLSPASVFNLALSPKQCLLRKGNYFISCLNMQEAKQLVFQNLDKNQGLRVMPPTGRVVIENANETIGDLGVPYFKPVLFDFTAQAANDIIQRRKSNPRSVIRFTLEGITYVCIPQKEGIQPATDAAQAYQLLAGPGNDITLLNNYYGD